MNEFNYVDIKNVVEKAVINVSMGQIKGNVDFDAKFMDDYAFNSIDIMDILFEIQEFFSDNGYTPDIASILEKFYEENDVVAMTANILIKYVIKLIEGDGYTVKY